MMVLDATFKRKRGGGRDDLGRRVFHILDDSTSIKVIFLNNII